MADASETPEPGVVDYDAIYDGLLAHGYTHDGANGASSADGGAFFGPGSFALSPTSNLNTSGDGAGLSSGDFTAPRALMLSGSYGSGGVVWSDDETWSPRAVVARPALQPVEEVPLTPRTAQRRLGPELAHRSALRRCETIERRGRASLVTDAMAALRQGVLKLWLRPVGVTMLIEARFAKFLLLLDMRQDDRRALVEHYEALEGVELAERAARLSLMYERERVVSEEWRARIAEALRFDRAMRNAAELRQCQLQQHRERSMHCVARSSDFIVTCGEATIDACRIAHRCVYRDEFLLRCEMNTVEQHAKNNSIAMYSAYVTFLCKTLERVEAEARIEAEGAAAWHLESILFVVEEGAERQIQLADHNDERTMLVEYGLTGPKLDEDLSEMNEYDRMNYVRDEDEPDADFYCDATSDELRNRYYIHARDALRTMAALVEKFHMRVWAVQTVQAAARYRAERRFVAVLTIQAAGRRRAEHDRIAVRGAGQRLARVGARWTRAALAATKTLQAAGRGLRWRRACGKLRADRTARRACAMLHRAVKGFLSRRFVFACRTTKRQRHRFKYLRSASPTAAAVVAADGTREH